MKQEQGDKGAPEVAQPRAKSGTAAENTSGNANGAVKPSAGDKKAVAVNRMAAMWSKAHPKKAAPPSASTAQTEAKPSVVAAKPSAAEAKPGVARKRSAAVVCFFFASSHSPTIPNPFIHLP